MRQIDQITLDAFKEKKNQKYYFLLQQELREQYSETLARYDEETLYKMIEEADHIASSLGFTTPKGYNDFIHYTVGIFPLLYENEMFIGFMKRGNKSAEIRLKTFYMILEIEYSKIK